MPDRHTRRGLPHRQRRSRWQGQIGQCGKSDEFLAHPLWRVLDERQQRGRASLDEFPQGGFEQTQLIGLMSRSMLSALSVRARTTAESNDRLSARRSSRIPTASLVRSSPTKRSRRSSSAGASSSSRSRGAPTGRRAGIGRPRALSNPCRRRMAELMRSATVSIPSSVLAATRSAKGGATLARYCSSIRCHTGRMTLSPPAISRATSPCSSRTGQFFAKKYSESTRRQSARSPDRGRWSSTASRQRPAQLRRTTRCDPASSTRPLEGGPPRLYLHPRAR